MSYAPGELVLVAFPYSSGGQSKNRPALVVADTGDLDIVVARVTTQLHQTPFDVLLSEWQAAGLLASSVVRLHKLATIAKSLVQHLLGSVQPADRKSIGTVLKHLYGNW
jgi:mRNA interferase MazF